MPAPSPPRPVMLVILDGWGWRDDAADNAVRAGAARPPSTGSGKLPARLPAHLGPRRRPAGRADGQFRGRASQHRRRPRGRCRSWCASAMRSQTAASPAHPALVALIDALRKIRRHLPPARPGLAGRRAFPPGSRGGAGAHARRGRHSGSHPRLHRRPRHAAALGGRRPRPAARRRCRERLPGRHRQRPLLRHGPRPPLGSRRAAPTPPSPRPMARASRRRVTRSPTPTQRMSPMSSSRPP